MASSFSCYSYFLFSDHSYKFIFKQEHPELSKSDKKRLCRPLDCQKLSPEVRTHAVKNERLPLRTVVQVLFFEQEKGSRANDQRMSAQEQLLSRGKQIPLVRDELSKLQLNKHEQTSRLEGIEKNPAPSESSSRDHQKIKRTDKKIPLESEKKVVREEIEELEIKDGGSSGSKMHARKIMKNRSGSDHSRDKSRDR